MAFEPGVGEPGPGAPLDERRPVQRRQVTRRVIAGLVLLVSVIFIVQNSERVETTFLVFSVTTRLWVGILVALVLGAILGQAAEGLWRRRRRGDDG